MSKRDKEPMLDFEPSVSAQRAQRFAEIVKRILIEKDYVAECVNSIEKRIISLEKKLVTIERKIDFLVRKLG